jgi:voltage-gated sodium channel
MVEYTSTSSNSIQSQRSLTRDVMGSKTSLSTDQSEILTNPSISALQKAFFTISESPSFNYILFVFIIINTIVCVVEPSIVGSENQYYIELINASLLGLFTFEVGVRLAGWRRRYFENAYNRVDFFLIVVGFGRLVVDEWIYTLGNHQLVRIIELVRILRLIKVFKLFRSVKFVQSIELILSTLAYSASAMTTNIALMVLTGYVYTVAAVYLLGNMDPENYGTVSMSARVMLQVLSQDSWSGLYIRVKSYSREVVWFLGSFLVLQSLLILNLLTAVIVDNLALLRQQSEKQLKKTALELQERNGNGGGHGGSGGGESMAQSVALN